MSTQKFDQFDRERTIRAIEERLGIKLDKVGSRPKVRVDRTGSAYWIFGGYGDWHGFPEKMIAEAQSQGPDGKLVIAKRTRTKIKIYCGPLKPLLQDADRLHRNKQRDRQFNLAWSGGHPSIKELPELHFELLAEVEYSQEEKEADRRVKEFKRTVAAMSDEDRAALLSTLERDSSS